MATQTISQELTGIQARFIFIIGALGFLIVFGSFFLAGQIAFAIRSNLMSIEATQYKVEYAAYAYNQSMLAAVGDVFSNSITVTTTSTLQAVGIPVLTYHSIVEPKSGAVENVSGSFEGKNVSLGNFKDQMFSLKQAGWETVTLTEFEAYMRGERTLPEKSFMITFDDGAKESFYPVDPILAALDYTAVAFILPSHSLGDRSTYYLNKNELKHLVSTGRWEIQSHGESIHTALPVTADGSVKENALSNRVWLTDEGRLETHEEYKERVEADLKNSKDLLAQALDVPITAFAFPFGDYGQNKSNHPQAQETIEAAARKEYTLAFYQNWNEGDFLFNYSAPGTFMIKRIPVDPDWGGETLLSLLGTHAPKPLPYYDDLQTNDGWQHEWGQMAVTDGALRLSASEGTTGALALLDGTYAWQDYEVEFDVEWTDGYVMVLFDMKSARTGRACVFSADGWVQLQERTEDDIFILRESQHTIVTSGAHRIGAIARDTTSACLFDGERVIDAELPETYGGIGAATWSSTPGTAEAFIKNTLVDNLK